MFLDSLAYKVITGGGLLSGEASFFTSEQLVNLSKLKANGQHRPIWCQQDLWEREFFKDIWSSSKLFCAGGTHLNPPILIFYSTQQNTNGTVLLACQDSARVHLKIELVCLHSMSSDTLCFTESYSGCSHLILHTSGARRPSMSGLERSTLLWERKKALEWRAHWVQFTSTPGPRSPGLIEHCTEERRAHTWGGEGSQHMEAIIASSWCAVWPSRYEHKANTCVWVHDR